MQERKGKKILIYFLLLLTVCSINNIALNKISFSNISNIKVLGLGDENNNLLYESISNLKLGNIYFIDKKELTNIISSNSLVEKYDIFKVYPSSLYINIKKTKFLARINQNGTNYIIGSNGKLSSNSLYTKGLPFIFGKPEIDEFLRFKERIDISKMKFEEIKNLYYFPTGRWDMELKNDILIKLPEKNINQSMDLVFNFLNNDKFDGTKVVDARIENQIILND
jgi:cell division protein FtsQ